jgi:glycosyltransferase involved in cell wall biosynthesis
VSPRRIMFLVNTMRHAGCERDVATMCKHIDRSRFEPEVWTLYAGGPHEATLQAAGVPLRCLHRKRAYDPMFALRAARAIAKNDADLMHVFSPALLFYAALARNLFHAKRPMLFTETTTASRRLMLPLHRYRLRQCTAFAANSEASRDNLVAHGVPRDRIHVIFNGHDLDEYHKPLDAAAMRASLGVRPDERLAIYVGRLIPTKRVCDLIDAVAQLDPASCGLRVVVAGDGPKSAELQAQAAAAGLNGVVQFVGMRSDVADLLRCADLFVFPSEVEGLSNSVIEAALAGLPIVGCDIGGVHDIVEHNREALLVSPRNPRDFAAAMRRLLDNRDEARKLGAAARARAEQAYSIDNTLNEHYRLYDEILRDKS